MSAKQTRNITTEQAQTGYLLTAGRCGDVVAKRAFFLDTRRGSLARSGDEAICKSSAKSVVR
jgi:hypothetical protein